MARISDSHQVTSFLTHHTTLIIKKSEKLHFHYSVLCPNNTLSKIRFIYKHSQNRTNLLNTCSIFVIYLIIYVDIDDNNIKNK